MNILEIVGIISTIPILIGLIAFIIKKIKSFKVKLEVEILGDSLIIQNIGRRTAFNVNFEVFNKDDEITDNHPFTNQKVPFEKLESGDYFEERIIKVMGMDRKYYLNILWEDKTGRTNNMKKFISF